MATAASSALPPRNPSRSAPPLYPLSREAHRLSSTLLRTCVRAHRCALTISGFESPNALHLWELVLQARELNEITCFTGVLNEVDLLERKVRRLERRVVGVDDAIRGVEREVGRIRRERNEVRRRRDGGGMGNSWAERRAFRVGNAGRRTTRLLKSLVRDIERMRMELRLDGIGRTR